MVELWFETLNVLNITHTYRCAIHAFMWSWGKTCGSPDAIPSVTMGSCKDFIGQGHFSKVKGQIKVTPWYCTPTTLTNVPTKYQLPTPYCCRDIAETRFSNSRSLLQGQTSNQGHTMMLHTYTP